MAIPLSAHATSASVDVDDVNARRRGTDGLCVPSSLSWRRSPHRPHDAGTHSSFRPHDAAGLNVSGQCIAGCWCLEHGFLHAYTYSSGCSMEIVTWFGC